MRYVLTSQRNEDVIIDGLGPLPPGEWPVDAEAVKQFEHMRGLSLVRAALPEGVSVTVVTEAAEE